MPPERACAAQIAVLVGLACLAISFYLSSKGFAEPGKLVRWLGVASLVVYGLQKRTLTAWILISMAAGVAVGYDFPAVGVQARVLSKIFLKMIKTIIAPLLFGTLVVGIAGHSNLKQVGRMGLKAIIYFEVVTTLALFIGLAAINLSQAGVGVEPPAVMEETDVKGVKQSAEEIILHVFPENVAKSVAEGQVLQIVVFSVMFAIALAQVDPKRRQPMLAFAESLTEVMFKFTNMVMLFAPIGVGAAIAYTVAHMGVDILFNLAKLVLTLYGALAGFCLLVLLPIALIARLNVPRFVKRVAEPVSLAFATTSSEAALPIAMEEMERFGVPRQIVAFVMPTGYSFNLDGTTLYLALASVFVAQAQGLELSLGTQLGMCLTLMLTSKGVAGVPRASLVILLGTAATFGLQEWPILAILGVDELMDMARTSINVTGNCLASAVIARWEGELREPLPEVFERHPAHPLTDHT
ncbi:MAG: cation:dicarboxylase symporter family transporter [Armatimonadetes bacterium]|nr:cation:dicarboxylase symporter family transporter [Armatimonadota bacterium]